MADNKDFFTLNNIDFDKAYKMTFGASGEAKLFFLEQLCNKQIEEIAQLYVENEKLKEERRTIITALQRANIYIGELENKYIKQVK